jgi:hypothetical protein
MRKEIVLQLIGIAIFLIATTLTYGIVTPVQKNATSLESVTDKITNTTGNTTTNVTETPIDGTSRLINNYHILIAIVAGLVIAIVIVFLLGFW